MQSRFLSAIETTASTVVGFGVSLCLTYTILPIFGYNVTSAHAWGITATYTGASIVRGYFIRRLFNGRSKARRG